MLEGWVRSVFFHNVINRRLTEEEQVEANGELGVFSNKRKKRGFGGCLPNFVQRHEVYRLIIVIE